MGGQKVGQGEARDRHEAEDLWHRHSPQDGGKTARDGRLRGRPHGIRGVGSGQGEMEVDITDDGAVVAVMLL